MPKILFDHLQKTGGTALTDFLRQNIGEHRVSPIIQHEGIRFAAGLLDQFDVVAGHFHLSPAYKPEPGVYYLTLLRDPVERFLSHYSYVREQPDATESFAALARRSKDLLSLLLSGDENVLLAVKDFYIRHFAALFYEEDKVRAVLADDRFKGRSLFPLTVSRYHLIGISEDMDGVAQIMSHLIGFPHQTVERVRVTKDRLRVADLDKRTLKILHDLTARDREFYATAKANFAVVVKAFGHESPHHRISLADIRTPSTAPVSDTPAILAAELFCPKSDHNDRAISGEPCLLSFALRGDQVSPDEPIALRITNTLHQLVFRDTRQLHQNTEAVSESFEIAWSFVCLLGPGDYICALALGTQWIENAYRFGVDQRQGSAWAGLVNMQLESILIAAPPDPDKLTGQLTASHHALDASNDETLEISVEIGNTGTTSWEPNGIYRVVISYRILTASGETVVTDGLRTVLPEGLAPNETRSVTMRLRAPGQAGHYLVTPSFVCERIAWFGGSDPIRLSVGELPQSHP